MKKSNPVLSRSIVSDTKDEQVQREKGTDYVYHKYYCCDNPDAGAYLLAPVYSRPVKEPEQ